MIKIVVNPKKSLYLVDRDIQGVLVDNDANTVHILSESTQNDLTYRFGLDTEIGQAILAWAEASSDLIQTETAKKIAGTIPKDACACGSGSSSGSSTEPTCYAKGYYEKKDLANGTTLITHNLNLTNPKALQIEIRDNGVLVTTTIQNQTANSLEIVSNSAITGADITIFGEVNCQAASGDAAAPSVPLNLVANPVSQTQIDLTWQASNDNVGVIGYEIEYSTDPTFATGVQTQSVGNVTTAQITGLNPSTTYYFRVRAKDAAGNLSAFSSPANATTLAASDTTPPSDPLNVVANPVSQTQIDLTWQASNDNVGVIGYEIEYSTDPTFATGVQTQSVGNVLNASITGLNPSTQYFFRVRAKDAAGNISNWATANATTLSGVTPPPSDPLNLQANAVSSTEIDLTWTASTGTVTGYEIDYSTDATFATGVQTKSVGNVITAQITGLTPSTQYFFRVRAFN